LGMYTPPQRNLPSFQVALKELKPGSAKEDEDDLMKEAIVSVQFDHPNIVTAIGVVTSGQPRMLVLEFCGKGELQGILKKAANPPYDAKRALSRSDKRKFCHDIVKGMAYLADCHVVHRDLATRNVLVDDRNNGKVADFGLARDKEEDEYYIATAGKVPVRWTAPEAMKDRKFSEKSDVWAFGITCIEIWEDGRQPYGEHSVDFKNAMVMEQVIAGYKLKCKAAPKPFYKDVISKCLEHLKADRPTFAEMLQAVEERLVDEIDDVDGSDVPKVKARAKASATGFIPPPNGCADVRICTATTCGCTIARRFVCVGSQRR
jgi:serine/threonine protein kinase